MTNKVISQQKNTCNKLAKKTLNYYAQGIKLYQYRQLNEVIHCTKNEVFYYSTRQKFLPQF